MKRKWQYIAAGTVLAAALLAGQASAVTLIDVDETLELTVQDADEAGLLPSSLDQALADQTVTREQLCSTAVRVYAAVKQVDYSTLAEKAGARLDDCPFLDTSSDDVRLAWLLGLTTCGEENGRFQPDKAATRQMMNTMLYRAISVAKETVSLSQNQVAELLSDCKDEDELSDWAREPSAYFLLQGIIEPEGKKNKLNPTELATSEELAVTAYRAASAGKNSSMQTSAKKLTALSTHSGQDRVSWSNCDADSYRVYYYEKSGFDEEPVYIDLVMADSSSTLEVTIPDCVQEKTGNWYWSVDAFDCDGKIIGSTESTTRLRVTEESTTSADTDTSSSTTVSSSEAQSAAKSGLAYAGESFESRCERIFGAGTTYYRRYSSESEAASHQTTIQIKVWRLGSNGHKYSDTTSLTVNSAIADTVQQIFKEIYESDEKFPIKDIGGYNWRGDNSASQHCLGLAIDINYNENYMCSNDGTALTGSYWLPGSDPYSIAADSDVVRIFAKYGFVWGGTWNSKKDYMHFSYFGT